MLCPLTTVAERAAGKAVILEFSEACDGVQAELVGGTEAARTVPPAVAEEESPKQMAMSQEAETVKRKPRLSHRDDNGYRIRRDIPGAVSQM